MKNINVNNTIKKIIYCFLFILLSYQLYNKTTDVITNSQPHDGFGSQFQTIIATAVYAELNGLTYAYTPFVSMEHNYDDAPAFIANKEWLINFIGNFEPCEKPSHSYSNINFKNFFDSNIEVCAQSNSLKKIRECFKRNKNKADYFDLSYCNIVVHIRRPNPHDSRIDGTDTPDLVYLSIIAKLRALHADKNIRFHIFSQGDETNFISFKNKDTILHLNDSIEYSFSSLVFADVLVTSGSSFSYTAALLSDGIVYYLPFWHTPLPHWISIETLIKKESFFINDKCIRCIVLNDLLNRH